MRQIPMLDLKLEYDYMKADIDAAIRVCLEHQKWILGPEVKELEDKIADYLGVKHCIGVASGTDALVLSLRALAINTKAREYFDRSDEIITTSFTFTATGDAILRAGATPVFVDVDPVTYNIDPQKIKEFLAKNSKSGTPAAGRVVGIVPVHLYGQACGMDEIMRLAEEYGLFAVEDVAQAFGGAWKEKKLGSFGMTGAFSFFPSKNLGGFGDGGMVATDDDEMAELIRMLLKHGGKDKYNVEHIGYNARLDTIQAAVILSKLKFIDEFNEKRAKIAEVYNKELEGIDDLVVPHAPHVSVINNNCHVYHQYTVRVTNGKRDELQRYLRDKGINSMVYYPILLHEMQIFNGRCLNGSDLATAVEMTKQVLSIPIGPLQTEDVTRYVAGEIASFFNI